MRLGARGPHKVADGASERKIQDFTQKVAQAPPAALNGGRLGFRFIPLAFDSLGTPSEKSAVVIDEYAEKTALRNGTSTGSVKCKIHQKISYAIWSTCAAAILGRAPQHSEVEHPSVV